MGVVGALANEPAGAPTGRTRTGGCPAVNRGNSGAGSSSGRPQAYGSCIGPADWRAQPHQPRRPWRLARWIAARRGAPRALRRPVRNAPGCFSAPDAPLLWAQMYVRVRPWQSLCNGWAALVECCSAQGPRCLISTPASPQPHLTVGRDAPTAIPRRFSTVCMVPRCFLRSEPRCLSASQRRRSGADPLRL